MVLSYTRVLQFLTIVKHMNMTKAAQELYISQPAISSSLNKLEEELGVPLFYRDKNKLILTSQAENLLPLFEQFRNAHDLLVKEAQSLAHSSEQQISMSFTGSTFFFPVFNLSGFFHGFPDLNVKLSYVDVPQATTMLLTNQTDFALSYYPITHALISTKTILSEPIGLVVPKHLPLAKKSRVEMEELAHIPLCVLSKKHRFRSLCDEICEANNVHLTYSSECSYRDYFAKMQEIPSQNIFLSTFENYELNFEPLDHYVFLPINSNDMCRKVGISYVTSKNKQYQHEAFLEYIKENFVKQNRYVNSLSQFFNQQDWNST